MAEALARPLESWLDRRAARRWFEGSTAPSGADRLAREVESRMAARLDYIKCEPARILDVGCGNGESIAVLRRRYPKAEILAADFAFSLVRRARTSAPAAGRMRSLLGATNVQFCCADMSTLPLAADACALVWSNLALAWSNDHVATIAEWHRVLNIGGLLMFSTYGPDTLQELREAFALVDSAPHVHPFMDMHDLGDALVRLGFADPVMDMERLTVTYASLEALVADLRANGQRNAAAQRRRALTGRGVWSGMAAAYGARTSAARLPATFEIVYGHAWKSLPSVARDGRAIVRFDAGRSRRKAD